MNNYGALPRDPHVTTFLRMTADMSLREMFTSRGNLAEASLIIY